MRASTFLLGVPLLVASTARAEPRAPAETASPAPMAKPPLVDFEIAHRHAFVARSISHDAVVGRAELRFAPKWSVALSGAYFEHFDQSYGQSPSAFPLTRTFGTIDVEMKGFLSSSHDRTKELYLLAGTGSIWTKPVSLVDPLHRRFDFEHRITCTFGVGGRIALTPVLAAFVEVRQTAYVDHDERASLPPFPQMSRDDEKTWEGKTVLRMMIQTQIGLTLSIPRS